MIYFLWDNQISPGNLLKWNSSPSMLMVSGVYATNSHLQESPLVTQILEVTYTGSFVYLACNIDHIPSSYLSFENWLSQRTVYTQFVTDVVISIIVQSVLNHSGNTITISCDSVWCICWIATYRGVDKSLARPDWKNNWKVAIFRPKWRSLLPRRPGWTDNFLNFFWVACKSYSLVAVGCFLLGRAKDLSAPR
jgi:hypothetical protein